MISTLTTLAKSKIKRNKGVQQPLWKDINYINKVSQLHLKYILEETSNYALNTISAKHAVRYLNGHTRLTPTKTRIAAATTSEHHQPQQPGQINETLLLQVRSSNFSQQFCLGNMEHVCVNVAVVEYKRQITINSMKQ